MATSKVTWDPAKYVEFGDFRNRPYFDLTARVIAENPQRVVDLGCGPGNLTATLAQRWPGAGVIGLDSSEEMVAKANADHHLPNLSFELADIATWMPSPDTDVIVSNAALQWVPGHQSMMAKWLAALKPGGWLAVQVPSNFQAPSHVLMRQLAASPRWSAQLQGVLRHDDAVAAPAEYLALLLDAGAHADVWETSYQQLLSGEDPVLNWVRGTGLRPVLQALGPEDSPEFEGEYAQLLSIAYPQNSHGTVFPFSRIFMVAQKQ